MNRSIRVSAWQSRNGAVSTFCAEVKDQAVAVRAALEASGLDHGPISVHLP